MRTIEARALSMTFLLALGAGACTGDAEDGDGGGDAQLTIVGERSLRLENGWATELTVRYTDSAGQPLAGQIEFTMDGELRGAFLEEITAITDAAGEAQVTLTTGDDGDATFTVQADAADTEPVAWDVSVLEKALEVAGTYRVTSEFDLASGLPGTAGTVINTFIDMTDDPYDPATWVLDQVVAAVDNGTVEDLVNGARPALDAILNELLISLTPDIVEQLIQTGDAFGQIARKFGTGSTLEIDATTDVDTGLVATHILNQLIFTIDGETYPYAIADMGMAEPSAEAAMTYDATRFSLGAHDFGLSYGSILMVALEQIIIPLVNPFESDLTGLLSGVIDCAAVGEAISEEIGFGSAGLYEGACDFGLEAAAGYIEDLIRSLDDTAMVLGISGQARWMDNDRDHTVDLLQGGAWTGNMTYGSTPAPLGDSSFRGERMTGPQ